MAEDDFRRSNRLAAYQQFLTRMDEAEIAEEQAERLAREVAPPTESRSQSVLVTLGEASDGIRQAGTTVSLLGNSEASITASGIIRYHAVRTANLRTTVCKRPLKADKVDGCSESAVNRALAGSATALKELREALRRMEATHDVQLEEEEEVLQEVVGEGLETALGAQYKVLRQSFVRSARADLDLSS